MKNSLLILLQSICLNCFAQLKPIESGVIKWDDTPVKKEAQRESRKLAEGTTSEFEYFKIHASTQMQGALPKPVHSQKDIEELIIVKEGTMKCTIGDKIAVLGKGSVLLIPPLQPQVFENAGNGPLTYYVFQFRSKKAMNIPRCDSSGGPVILNYDSLVYTEKNNKGSRKYFDRPTAMCENYEMHVTYLKQKGPSHAAHVHVDTEIILIIDGEAEMTIDGKYYTGGPGDLFIANSGELHQVGNASEKLCSYFAIRWR